MIGRILAPYRIVEEISRGGMGVVYRAVDTRLGREVALKVLPEALLHDPIRRERLLQEARAASALEHPHIAVIHGVDDVDGVTFIAMELIRGEKLSDVLSRGPLPQKRALDLAIEVAEGLARAHEKAVIHRDLKPANVMVTDEGHAKIIDFGLAKLIEPISHEAATATLNRPDTEPGVVLGTAAYMAPEQARGGRTDHRGDIFSLGVMLFEMLTGRPAFQGASSIDTMHAILTQPMPPLPTVAGLADEAAARVQLVIDKCTAKDPDERYQGMKDVVVDLRAARRLLESSQGSAVMAPRVSPAAPPGVRSRSVVQPVAIGVLVLAAAAAWWWTRREPAAPTPSGKPGVAVLFFENNTGDASLDWMRTGLTDMMVTDLSQSTDIEVLGTDRLYQILQELNRADDRLISADVIREIADRSAVDNVLLGSYVKAGDTIRINARLQEARTGRIVTSERVEGPGGSSVFSLVDELTRRFKAKMAGAGVRPGGLIARPGDKPDEAVLDRDLKDVTTSSIAAYRFYAEGINFHNRGLTEQAVPLLEKAAAIDPEFAMALAKLAVVHNNLGHISARDDYALRALALIKRLTARERYYIEGFYYTLRPETLARGIDAYKQGLALHPDHLSSRHNLGLKYFQLERFAEAIEQYEELLRRGAETASSHANLESSYRATGDMRRALELAEAFVGRNPENANGFRNLGSALTSNGRLDEARTAYEKADALNPGSFQTRLGRWTVAILQDRWADADRVLKEMAAAPDSFQPMLGLSLQGVMRAGRGRGRDALASFERAARAPGAAPEDRAFMGVDMAKFALRNEQPAAALAYARQALADARNNELEFAALQVLAIAQAVNGRHAESDASVAQLESRATILPSNRELRRVHWARGDIALARGDSATAVAELTKAVAMLAPFGPVLGPPSSHPALWLAAALANIKAGRDGEAAALLERLQTRYERVFDLEAYARSFFLLGQIHERRGDATRAREQYARFVELWRDGDMERGWVAEARKKSGR